MNAESGGPEPPTSIPNPQENNTIKRDIKNIDYDNRYKESDSGPYFVFVEHEENNLGRLFPVRVGHYLFCNQFFKNSITDIKPIGLNRVKVILNTAKSANLLVKHELLTSKKLISYIPKYFTQKKGIIRMVDTYLEEDYIQSNIVSSIKVVDVKRMTRRIVDKDNQSKIIKRQMVILTFLGSDIPKDVKLNLCNFPVEPYIYPVIQCYKCLRYGHTNNQCKSTDVRCKFCSGNHESHTCSQTENKFCVFCKSDEHAPVDKKCPMYQKQLKIKHTMANKNLSFKEAESLVNNPSYAKVVTNNRFALLADTNNFPSLPTPNHTNNDSIHPQRKPNRHPNNSQAKKRKAGRSPARENTPPPSTVNCSILPNPYREEFMSYKNSLVEQISNFIIGLIQNLLTSSPNIDSINQLNIKETLAELFAKEDFNTNNDSGNEQYNDEQDEY